MKIGRILRLSVLLVALAICASGVSWADPTAAEIEATVAYPLETEIMIQMKTINGTRHDIVWSTAGEMVMDYSRPVGSTAWTVTGDSDETYSYYRAIPAQYQTDATTYACCAFLCDAGHVVGSPPAEYCAIGYGERPCNACTQQCPSVNGTCPGRIGTVLEYIGP